MCVLIRVTALCNSLEAHFTFSLHKTTCALYLPSNISQSLLGLFWTDLDVVADLLDDPALDGRFTQDVVGSDARLPAVDKLAPGDATVSRENKQRLALLFRAHNV